jgi:2-hydroxychromene-2-carboxylate isomerase
MPVVDAYLGLGSRYSYLASTQFDRIAHETGASFNWIPIFSEELLGPGRNPFAGTPVSGQYEWFYRRQDAEAWADYYQVPFREPMGRLTVDYRLLVRAALAAGALKNRIPMMKRLFAAVFVDDRTDIDTAACIDCAVDVGIERNAFRNAFQNPAIEAERFAIVERAQARGVFGVPFFFTGGRTYFGNDRLVLLAHHLKKANRTAEDKDGKTA